ncbi:MAG: caspase family protein, partial [Candidatus Electrothrix sp. AUS1_2]|nr:caspase family protein [Candidatus Electrothrix sp. AUS1_2]
MNRLYLKKIFFLLIWIAVSYPALLNAQRGLRVVNTQVQDGLKVVDSQGTEQILYHQSYALLIGVSDYTAGWPDLPGVREDIAAVERILKQHNFTVTKVSDPDRKNLDAALEKFIQDYGLDEGNRLLIYFAGHGYTIKKKYGGEMGYIVPVDAPNPHVDHKGFLRKAMSIEEFGIFAKRIDSKHAIFIFDSCFAGSIFPKTRAIPASISDKTSKPVRQFITSGSAEEEVPDVSVFRRHLVDALSGSGDSNKDGYITGSELGLFLEDKVVNDSNNTQHPQYGKIVDSRLNQGDFVFILPQNNQV